MEEKEMFDILIEKTQKYLKKHPNVSVGDFSNGYLFPILQEIVDRVGALEADVDDVLESMEVPEQPFVQEATTTVMDLVGFIDIVLVRAGWLGEGGPTEAFPIDLRQKFTELQGSVVSLTERLRQLAEAGVEDTEETSTEETSTEETDSDEQASTEPADTTAEEGKTPDAD